VHKYQLCPQCDLCTPFAMHTSYPVIAHPIIKFAVCTSTICARSVTCRLCLASTLDTQIIEGDLEQPLKCFRVSRDCFQVYSGYYKTVGLARTIYIRCIYGIICREITKYTVIYGVFILFWPTLQNCIHVPLSTTQVANPIYKRAYPCRFTHSSFHNMSCKSAHLCVYTLPVIACLARAHPCVFTYTSCFNISCKSIPMCVYTHFLF
jgi:hypothetical protein